MVKSIEKFNINNKPHFISHSSNSTDHAFSYSSTTSSYAYALTIISTWGSPGSGNGQFNSPSGMDLDFKGHLYVVDSGNNRIQKFNATDGKFISKWGSSGSGPGQFSSPIECHR